MNFIREINPLPDHIVEQLKKKYGEKYKFISIKFDQRNNKYFQFICTECNNEYTRRMSQLNSSNKNKKEICIFCAKAKRKEYDSDWLKRLKEYENSTDNYFANKDFIIESIKNGSFDCRKTKLLVKSKKFSYIFDVKTADGLLNLNCQPFWESTYSGAIDKFIEQVLLQKILNPSFITKEFQIKLPSGKHKVDYVITINHQDYYINFGFSDLEEKREKENCKTKTFNEELKDKYKDTAVILYKNNTTADMHILDTTRAYETRLKYLYEKIYTKSLLIINYFSNIGVIPNMNAQQITNEVFDDVKKFYNYYYDFYKLNKAIRIELS